ELLSTSQGVNVIAPTWFSLSDNDGNYESLASKSYVDKAHAMGIQVWAVLDNFSRECSQNVQSEKLFAKTAARKKLISKLMKEADTYGFDGINLDFESLQEAAGVHYVQFIRELSVSCREKGIILSVDNYVPAAYNKFYNRKEQGIVADYVIIMGYDEHYAGGDPGSVASLGYVEKGIKDTVDIVPKEKVINGVPFYTRLWTQKGDKITSKAMGIFSAKQWISDNNVELIWEEEIGQYYGEVQTADGFSYLWMEDAKSLGLKMDLIKKYDLAGVSGWKLGLETQDMWDVFGWR
ncbi:MAG: glycosyl hydrolase family 18 protein, partial [Clostridium sp.]